MHNFFLHRPDQWMINALTTIAFLMIVVLCVRGWMYRRLIRAPLIELSERCIDNVQALAFGVAVQISRCKDAKDLNKAVGAIGRYEWEFQDDPNAKVEVQALKKLLDEKVNEIYGVETIVS